MEGDTLRALAAKNVSVLVTAGERGYRPLHALVNPLERQDLLESLDQRIKAFVSVPPPEILDLAASVLSGLGVGMVAFLVPTEYVSNPHAPREAWFQQLVREERMIILADHDEKTRKVQRVWLVWVATSELRSKLVLPHVWRQSRSWAMAPPSSPDA